MPLVVRPQLICISYVPDVESKCKGGVPNDGASGLVWESMMGGGSGGDTGSGNSIEDSGEEGIRGSGDDHGESGNDGGVDIARSLVTFESDQAGVGTGARIEILLQECVSNDIMECDCLAQKLSEQPDFVSKEIYTELLRSFAKLEKHLISLEIALQQCQEQLKNDTVCKEKASNVFRKEREQYFEILDLKENGSPFSDSLERKYFAKKKSVLKTNESEGLSKPITPQNLPQTAKQAVRNTNVIKPGMYRIASSTTQTRAPQLNQTSRNTNPRVSTSTGVAHKTNVSRPQPRSNQMKDKVVPNTSHVKFKKTEVEEHPRISSISNQTKSVTACNDSLNSRTSNVNAVCATCGKCVFNSNHDACVSKFLKDVNARTKKPNVVPISTRKPKSQANKSVATPHKKTVASESTITNSKSYYRMLYKKTSKAWKWWIAQQCPSAYTWVPKTKRKWVPKVRNESVTKKVSFSIDNIVQLIPFIVDSGCTKHMTGNLSLLCNFVEKYLGTVYFGNDQFTPILGYEDLVQGNITIKRGNDLLTGNRGTDLYTISLQENFINYNLSMANASQTQAVVMASKTFLISTSTTSTCFDRKDVVIGLPKLIYTWTLFLCSKDETPKVLKGSFFMMIQRFLQATVISVRTIDGLEFLNKHLNQFFKEEGIEHQNLLLEHLNRTVLSKTKPAL
ncbi:hypothetical protein Tco_0864068 [Tanacetum coccineum]